LETVNILEGETFIVSNKVGDLEGSPTNTHGLFHQDTRYLSRWILKVNGIRPSTLSVDTLRYFAAQFFLAPVTGAVYVNSKLSIIRTRAAGDGFFEDLTIFNYDTVPVDVVVEIEFEADFADLFEIKDQQAKKGKQYQRKEGNDLVLGYRRDEFVRETRLSVNQPAEFSSSSIVLRARIEAQSKWTAGFDVMIARDAWGAVSTPPKYRHGDLTARPAGKSLDEWKKNAPQLSSSMRSLERTYERSIVDLAALRFFPPFAAGGAIAAAGLPWFMAVFGRDSLITGYQALPFEPELAATALKVLANTQGSTVDDFREEEPGKIIHETRWGELTAFEERPQSPYYGSNDVTPLFLILLDEYERWTGDKQLVASLEGRARAALRWIDEFGDRDGDGYLEYERKNKETGLENQCWKDSWDSIVFADGKLAPTPRACCEIQGYVYDAKMRCARLARDIWNDQKLAAKLEEQARALKERFNRDFWIKSGGYFALALDGQKRQVDALTSNIGHLLWSGIVDKDKAELCVRHLMGPQLFSGWGIRTLAMNMGSYNPIGYHVGTIWPHDNSLIAIGLRRYGYRAEAARLALAILEAAEYFENRLPEAFAGYPRDLTQYPVEYPTACSPQAWATGAPLLMLRSLLGLQPAGEHLIAEAAIPEAIARLELLGIPGRWGRADAFGRGLIRLEPELKAA
jgi:glycogen debranching enzyme